MKKINILLSFAVMLSMISCENKNNEANKPNIPAVPDSGMYISKQFNNSDITVIRNIVYSTRANAGGQYTSDSTMATDSGMATLTLTMDIAIPPNATAAKKQPL